MKGTLRNILYFLIMAVLIIAVGQMQSWNLALSILNLCLISAIMALGVNIQWGYAGLFNVGVMGFAALGGLAAMLVAMPPVREAWSAAGSGTFVGFLIFVVAAVAALFCYRKFPKGTLRTSVVMLIVVVGYVLLRMYFDPTTKAIEKVNPAADYLAIATLGISEIIVAVLKHEDWMTRGVKNVTGLPRPVPYEVDLQNTDWFLELAAKLGTDPVTFSSIFVKICYASLFAVVLLLVLYLSEKALRSPWGRMMRAIRDNEVSANAMGKDVTARHLQVFVLGSIIVGIAGAMLTTLDGQLTPSSYQPLRFTFLIWVMVIVGGSGNNWGAVLGGFVIWFFWVEAEPLGLWLMDVITSGMAADNPLRLHLIDSAAHMRLMTMGLILLLALRFSPKGLIPERNQ